MFLTTKYDENVVLLWALDIAGNGTTNQLMYKDNDFIRTKHNVYIIIYCIYSKHTVAIISVSLYKEV